jgi:lipopolysaccharide transport system permease protein
LTDETASKILGGAPVGRDEAGWTTVILPEMRGRGSTWSELWPYRELIWLLFWRDFVAMYKQTILGPLWFLLQPIMTSTAFTVVFAKIAKIPTDGVNPFLFYLAGVAPWQYFATCLTATSTTLTSNAGLFGKVYFPRLVVPVALLMTNLLSFAIQFVFFLGLYLVFYLGGAPLQPNFALLLVPLLLVHLAALGLGFGLMVSSLTTKYRDLNMVLGFGVQLWMYATPIVYPLSQIPANWHWLFFLNPMTAVIETFRYAFFGVGVSVPPAFYAISVSVTVLVVSFGVRMFHRAERTFLDTI